MSAISKKDTSEIVAKLPNKHDSSLACSLIEAVDELGGGHDTLNYKINEKFDDDHFILYVRNGIGVFTDENVAMFFNRSVRVVDVRISFEKRRIALKIVRYASGDKNIERESYMPIQRRKKQHYDIDFAQASIIDRDDQRTIRGIISEVYHIAEIMKTTVWFESIVDEYQQLLHSKPPRMRSADDASEVSLEDDRVGYAICFYDMPEFSATFMDHLKQLYGALISTLYVLFDADQPTVFVVNVRRTSVPRAKSHTFIKKHVPRAIKRQKVNT